MVDKDWTFVLGAQDPEMREIERTLDDAGIAFVHAARGRRRCSAQNAYDADGVVRVGRDAVPRPALLVPQEPSSQWNAACAACSPCGASTTITRATPATPCGRKITCAAPRSARR
jgi:hypothetical protein